MLHGCGSGSCSEAWLCFRYLQCCIAVLPVPTVLHSCASGTCTEAWPWFRYLHCCSAVLKIPAKKHHLSITYLFCRSLLNEFKIVLFSVKIPCRLIVKLYIYWKRSCPEMTDSSGYTYHHQCKAIAITIIN